jgi:hypothetical protein
VTSNRYNGPVIDGQTGVGIGAGMTTIKYAQALRLVGRMLDERGARLIQIEEDEARLTVFWQDSSDEWQSQAFGKKDELEDLLRAAIKGRGAPPLRAHQSLEPLLRTLGQDLDRKGISLGRIREVRGFQVRTETAGQPVDSYYSVDELITKNRERQTPRPQPAKGRSFWRWPFSLRKRAQAAVSNS